MRLLKVSTRHAAGNGSQPTIGSLAYNTGGLSAFWAYLTGRYSREWAEAINTVYVRADYNASRFNIIPFVNTYRLQDVEAVMNSYGNLAAEKHIPEYDERPGGANDANKRKTWDLVAKASGQTLPFVQLVMFEFYYATMDRSVPNACFLRPVTCESYAGSRSTAPPDGQGYAGDLKDMLTTILLAAAGLGVVYLIVTKR